MAGNERHNTGRFSVRKAFLIAFSCSCILLVSCSETTPEELASIAAKGYYDHLLQGEYGKFLEGKAGADSLPEQYRGQLIAGYKQFIAQQNTLHRGINEVRVVNARRDTLLNYTNVFLMFCFNDSTNEQVSVPMVEYQGRWRMK